MILILVFSIGTARHYLISIYTTNINALNLVVKYVSENKPIIEISDGRDVD